MDSGSSRVALVASLGGLALGILAFLLSVPFLGLGAGLAAVVAGIVTLSPSKRIIHLQQANVILEADLISLRRRLQDVEDTSSANVVAGIIEESANIGSHTPLDVTTTTELAGGKSQTVAKKQAGTGVIDVDSGLYTEEFFRVTLDARLASARRHLRPVALVLIYVTEDPEDKSAPPISPHVVSKVVLSTLREADSACRLDDNRLAVILEDTPETGALWTVERLRRELVDDSSDITVWAGLACYPAHAFTAAEMIVAADDALGLAQEWSQDRVEIAAAAD